MNKAQVFYKGRPIVGRMPPFRPALRALVRAGKKTVTRRAVKLPGPKQGFTADYRGQDIDRWREVAPGMWQGFGYVTAHAGCLAPCLDSLRCPYGKPGDLRVMIEPLCRGADGLAHYRDDGALVISLVTGQPIPWRWGKDVLTSIHMPTEAARVVVEYVDMRAERLHDITEADAIAEGYPTGAGYRDKEGRPFAGGPIKWFSCLWDSINAARGHDWARNDWVWRVEWRAGE